MAVLTRAQKRQAEAKVLPRSIVLTRAQKRQAEGEVLPRAQKSAGIAVKSGAVPTCARRDARPAKPARKTTKA